MAMPMNPPSTKGAKNWTASAESDDTVDRPKWVSTMKKMIATRLLAPMSGKMVSVSWPSDWYSRMTIWVAAGAVVMDISAKNPAASSDMPIKATPVMTRIAVSPISTTLMVNRLSPNRRMVPKLKLPPMLKTISPRMTSCRGTRCCSCALDKRAGSPSRPSEGPAATPTSR